MGKELHGSASDVAGAMTFLVGQLEFLDPIVHDPIHAETYAKYLYVKTGAGWVDGTSFINAKAAGGSQKLGSARANVIRRISADLTKTLSPVFTYQSAIDYTIAELNKAAKAGVNLDDVFTRMLRIDYEKMVDRIAFAGDATLSIPGLISNRSDSPYSYTVTTGTGGYLWSQKTSAEILLDLATLLSTYRSRSGYTLWPNTILVPETQWGIICSKDSGVAGYRSILDYFQSNNAATKDGTKLTVGPCKWCTRQTIEGEYFGGGSAGYDRMVAYQNNEAYTRFHLPVPLIREDVTKVDLKISVPYQALIGGVEVIHTESLVYADRI
jgi:hypothetical protein